MSTTPLDLSKFAKVVTLARHTPHEANDHDQHRTAAAWAQAERMAEAAGMTLEMALLQLGRQQENLTFLADGWPEHSWEAATQVLKGGDECDPAFLPGSGPARAVVRGMRRFILDRLR